MQRTGMVMETHRDYVIVLTADGEFCKVPCSVKVEAGQEIRWHEDSELEAPIKTWRKRRPSPWRRTWLTGMAACLAIAAVSWFGMTDGHEADAYAFVAIDMDPSVSLVVDQHYDVLTATGQNPDGKQLVSHLHLTGLPLKTAISEIVSHALTDFPSGSQQPDVLIAAAPATSTPKDLTNLRSETEQDVKTALQVAPKTKQVKPAVVSLVVSNSLWEASEKENISPAKASAFWLAHSKGYQGTLSQFNGSAVSQYLASGDGASSQQTQLVTATQEDANRILTTIEGLTGQTLGTLHESATNGIGNGGIPGTAPVASTAPNQHKGSSGDKGDDTKPSGILTGPSNVLSSLLSGTHVQSPLNQMKPPESGGFGNTPGGGDWKNSSGSSGTVNNMVNQVISSLGADPGFGTSSNYTNDGQGSSHEGGGEDAHHPDHGKNHSANHASDNEGSDQDQLMQGILNGLMGQGH